jgi:hypothetical protein
MSSRHDWPAGNGSPRRIPPHSHRLSSSDHVGSVSGPAGSAPSDRATFADGDEFLPQSSACTNFVELKVLNTELSYSESISSPLAVDALKRGRQDSPTGSDYGTGKRGNTFSVSCGHRSAGRRRRILETILSGAIFVSFVGVLFLVLNFTYDSLGAAEKVLDHIGLALAVLFFIYCTSVYRMKKGQRISYGMREYLFQP